MDVGGWLRGLGLGKYEESFRANAIDADLLPRLTVDDLKDIGVSVVGDRRRLLDAIAVIAGAGRSADVPASPTKAAPSKDLQASAERRPITVMFCDLVGSTSLAAKLDAEDWRNLVNAYLDEASGAVTGLGGHVLKKLGDGLMALFGYPQAQENDAERAVRAALAIQRALADLNARSARSGAPELSARIGIECGSVVVDANGEVFGEAPNVAARVQAAAEPGSVLVTGSVQRQVAGLFVVEEKGAHGFKGVAQPLSLYRVVRASGGGRRGGLRALTQFVGREEELGLLARRWERVRAGEGQLVLIVGEPGLGKSRLIEEFHSRLAETRHTWVEWSASQLLQNTPLHPIAEWGRFRFGTDAPAEQRLADLEGTLRLIGLGPAEYAPLLAPLVDIPLPLGRAAHFPPEELRRKQLAAMTAWVLAGARSQPVVLAFEDLHWADPTSLDLLRALADRGAQAPLLLLATTRPEFRAPWSLRPHHSLISLSPLDRAGVARMVGEISARHALSKELIEGVNERTGGVPLFVEEVTRLLVERGEQGSVQAIPPTLQLSLAARLDRLGPGREVAQIGAVLGRDFVYALLRDVAEIEEPTLQASLDRLADADLLFVEGAPPEANYRFKHALIQDAAYESLLKSHRQALHRRAAEALREANGEPEAIAHHFTEAGLDDVAIEWWGKAGDQALRRSAFQEAISHLGKAIAMADKATGAASRPNAGDATASRQRVKLQVDYSEAVMYYKGFSAEETRVAWARAAELGANRDDFSERSSVRHGQWTLAIVRGELHAAQEQASTFLREAEDAGRPVEASVAHRSLGVICYYSGDFLNARIHCERALDACRHERDFEARERFSDDTGAVAMSILAITSWHLGEVERASELINMANHRAAELDHAPSKVHPLYWKSILEILRGDAAAALITGEALEGICGEHGMGEWRAVAEMVVGWAHGRLANPAAGAAEMRQALAVLINKGMRIVVVFFQGLLADLELETLGADSAVARIDEALVSADQFTNFASLPFLHRLRGDTLLKRNPPNIAPAEDAYRTAIAIANRQGARSYELLASLSLAKLHRSTGRLVEAQAVLAPALEGFAPTPEMHEIAEAQALLAALSETEEMKTAVAQRERRLRLQTDYGRGVMYSRGFAAAETKSAFARAMELAARTDDFSARFSAFDGQCRSAIVRGELRSAWELASSFLREAEGSERLPETAAARRSLGLIAYFLGDFVAARGHLQQALHECDTEHDEEAWERFGDDTGAVAMSYLALTTWQLGEVERARELIDTANQRAAKIGHGPSKAIPLYWMSYLEILRGDPKAALCTAEALAALGQAHAMTHFSNMAELNIAWAHGRLADPAVGCSQFQKAFEAHLDHGFRIGAGFYTGLLAELEAETLGAERGLARIDEALLLADQVEYRCDLAFLHRLRGEILLKVDPGKPAPAEEAFQTAVAAAKQQGARSLGLQAALSLAKLYQSTSRPAEAHAVLAPALEGFSPTPEMPEIAEADALLAALADTAEVKAAEAQRQRRLHLQTAYGQAMLWSKGFAAEDTKVALAHAAELAGKSDGFAERFAACHGQWTICLARGELRSAREMALAYLKEAVGAGRAVEAGVARRGLALTCYFAGEFLEARTHCERALEACDPEHDRETRERFSEDTGTLAMSLLGMTMWQLGEPDRARELIDQAIRHATELGHSPSMAFPLQWKTLLAILRGDATAALSAADTMELLCREHGMPFWRARAEIYAAWARGRLHGDAAGAADLRRALTAAADQGGMGDAWFHTLLLAELEAERLGADSALVRTDEAIALARQVESRCDLPFAHLLRGKMLLARDPSNPGPAEEAFQIALAIAKQQGARSYELIASFSLAKLYQSTGRLAEAHVVLAPALEGFAPTPEMLEIAEAQALLVTIEAGTHVRHG